MEKKTHVIVASTILSILVWLSVSMNNQYSIAVRVPFRVSNLPEGISLASPVPRFIFVRVRGTGWQVASSYFSATASINFDASDLAKKQIILTSRDLGYSLDVGSSAEVLRFEPDTVLINLDSTMTKKVPVIPNIDVMPRQGFMIVGPPVADPDSVTITGARKLLRGIESWDTQPRKFEKIINEVSTTIPLSDTLAGIVTVDAREANVRVDVEQVADNTYRNIPVNVIDNFDSTEVLLLPPTVDVTVRGGINEMANITSDSFYVTVNFHSLSHSSSNSFRPAVKAPAQMQVIAVKPDSIEFIIRK
jgi:YbbR domain-containing protein